MTDTPHPMSSIWAEAFHAWEQSGHWAACEVLAKRIAALTDTERGDHLKGKDHD